MYNVEHFRKLMTGHDDLKEDEEPKKKKLSLKQLFDGEPKIIRKKKEKNAQPVKSNQKKNNDKKVVKNKLNKK